MEVHLDTGQELGGLEDYQNLGLRCKPWFVDEVGRQHRTMAADINMLIGSGFKLAGFMSGVLC